MPLAKAFISFESVVTLFLKANVVQCTSLLPADTQMRTVAVDVARGGLYVVLEAASFPVSGEGDLLPDIKLAITAILFREDLEALKRFLPSRTVELSSPEKPTGLP